MNDFAARPGMPAHLRPPAGMSVTPSAAGGSASPTGPAAEPTASGSDFAACQCACQCGNLTDMPASRVDSGAAMKALRCLPCARARHLGPSWNSGSARLSPGGAGDEVVQARSRLRAPNAPGSTRVVVRGTVTDPEDAARDAEIRRELEDERRTEARDRWLAGLPQRWQMDFTPTDRLRPEVTDRLTRIAQAGVGAPNTSLLCIGPFGTGKTWTAYTYARAAVERRLLWPREIRVGTEAEIVQDLAHASPWEVEAKVARLLHPGLKMLVVDDVGAMAAYRSVDLRVAAWARVVNWAYEHKRILVLTTNLAVGAGGELAEWIGETAYQRLRHLAGVNPAWLTEERRAAMADVWEAEYQANVRQRTT